MVRPGCVTGHDHIKTWLSKDCPRIFTLAQRCQICWDDCQEVFGEVLPEYYCKGCAYVQGTRHIIPLTPGREVLSPPITKTEPSTNPNCHSKIINSAQQ